VRAAWVGAVLLAYAAPCPSQVLDDNLRRAGFTELHAAVWAGDVAKIRRLVANGAKLDVASDSGTTPLHSAAMQDNAEVVRVLLELGAKLEATDRLGRTPLFVAAEVNPRPTKVIGELIAAGASPGARDNFGKTPRDACWTQEACRALASPRERPPATR